MDFITSKRVQAFEKLIFSELSEYKKNKQAEGIDMIDLSIGSPDLSPPPFIMEALIKNIQDPSQYGYTMTGSREFNQSVSYYYKKRFNVDLDADKEVLMLGGSQDGIVHLPMAFADAGDIILVPDPGYTAYEAGVKAAGAAFCPMPLLKENHFMPDLSKIPEKIAQKAKMMILNFPGNPIPALATYDLFAEIVAFAKKHQILVVHDFAYSELVFDGRRPVSFLETEGAKDIGVEFNSLSKSFNMAGCRIGYVAGHPKIINDFASFKSNLDYGVFSPIQKAAVAALKDDSDFLSEQALIYERRRNILVNGLNEIGWHVDTPPATMFIWAKIPEGWSSKQFAYELIDRAGVVVTPGIAFGKNGEGYVRIAMVQSEEKLRLAIERIKESGIIFSKTIFEKH
ncbi:LL-diaminopimelate aminotransferase [Scopulibacillus cellulosilyticus]|uniref:Aminotransferase n=1 Tax=Scopulibacillus cellulosilyticus TaxID=2665665 RepID=A0ABW2PTS5_9BACL